MVKLWRDTLHICLTAVRGQLTEFGRRWSDFFQLDALEMLFSLAGFHSLTHLSFKGSVLGTRKKYGTESLHLF